MSTVYVRVSFDVSSNKEFRNDGRLYLFRASGEYNEGDLVVVKCSTGFTVAKIVEVTSLVSTVEANTATAWIVQKVDLAAHEAAIERETKIKDIRAQMAARKAKIEEEAIFVILAEKDDKMKELLGELEELSKED